MSAYEGFWINRDEPAITGSVLTLSSLKSGFLVAFLALFVNATGQAFWRTLCFFIHQIRSNPGPHDGVYIQQQVILRNAYLPLSAIWDLLMVLLSWRRRARRLKSRSVALIIIATLNFAVWTAAGIFSAKLALSSDAEILLQSPRCGLHAIKIDQERPDRKLIIRPIRQARDYAQQCYEDVPSAEPICRTFVSKNLPWRADVNASCPFASDLCIGGDSAAFAMDTGLMDSHVHLGLNARPKDRVLYRKKATCAPLDLRNFTEILNGTYPDHVTVDFYLQDPGVKTPTVSHNVSLYGTGDYYLMAIGPPSPLSIPGTNLTVSQTWTLRDSLRRDDAVTSLLFLIQNSVYYPSAISDPFFSAHFTTKVTPNLTHYHWDQPISVLGCTEQHQICNPNPNLKAPDPERSCSNLSTTSLTPSELISQSKSLSFTPQQHTASILLQSLSSTISIRDTIYALGAQALRAQETLSSDLGNIALPETQWRVESASLFNITLAAFQFAFLDYVTPPSPFRERDKLTPVPRDLYERTCGRQKVRESRGEFVSFHVLGLGIVLGVGGVVIGVGFVVEDLVATVQRWSGRPGQRLRRAMWMVDGKLWLLRLAYEGKRDSNAGGRWEGGRKGVPVTGWGEVFDVEGMSGEFWDGDGREGGGRDGGQDQFLLGSWRDRRDQRASEGRISEA